MREQLLWELDQLPDLVQVMHEQVTPSIVFAGGEPVAGGGDKHTIPVRGDVLDDLDALWGNLDEFVDEVAQVLGYAHAPHSRIFADPRRSRGENRPGASQSPAEWHTAALMVVRWIRDRFELFALPDPEEFLADLIHQLRGRFMPHDKPHWWHTMRQCEQCMERAVGVTWDDTGHLIVACTVCGAAVVDACSPARSFYEEQYLAAAVEKNPSLHCEQSS